MALVFFEPVVVWTRMGARRSVSGVEEAAETLLYDFPGSAQGDRIVRAAMKACHDTMKGSGQAENVRAIFEAAAREVGVLAD